MILNLCLASEWFFAVPEFILYIKGEYTLTIDFVISKFVADLESPSEISENKGEA